MTRFTKPVAFATKEVEIKDFKMESGGNGGFSGYFSTFGNFDTAKEAVVKGAFLGTLEYTKQHGFLAINHDWAAAPLGMIKNCFEDSVGGFAEIEFHSTAAAQTLRTVMQERQAAGKSNRLSMGYKVSKSEPTPQGRLLQEIKLYEISFVNFPANELAVVGAVKSEGNNEDSGDSGSGIVAGDANSVMQLAAKSILLGDMAEAAMLLSGLDDLSYRLRWKMWETIADERLAMNEKINLCQAMLMEFAAIGIRAVDAFLSDPNAIALAGEKAAALCLEIKAGRALSGANREAMTVWSKSLKTVVGEMDDLLLQTRPDDEKNSTDSPETPENPEDFARKNARIIALLHGK